MTTLFIVATPIGNLKDITGRALETLASVDIVLAEDTRVTQKLLTHFGIFKPIVALHEHTEIRKVKEVATRITHGETAAFVCDAGTPIIADPGVILIQELLKIDPHARIIPIPGPSAVVAALSVAGMWANQYHFLGFVPKKKGREVFFKKVDELQETVVFFETPQRIQKTLETLSHCAKKNRKIVVCRELTKEFETVYYSSVGRIVADIPKKDFRGEFIVVVEASKYD